MKHAIAIGFITISVSLVCLLFNLYICLSFDDDDDVYWDSSSSSLAPQFLGSSSPGVWCQCLLSRRVACFRTGLSWPGSGLPFTAWAPIYSSNVMNVCLINWSLVWALGWKAGPVSQSSRSLTCSFIQAFWFGHEENVQHSPDKSANKRLVRVHVLIVACTLLPGSRPVWFGLIYQLDLFLFGWPLSGMLAQVSIGKRGPDFEVVFPLCFSQEPRRRRGAREKILFPIKRHVKINLHRSFSPAFQCSILWILVKCVSPWNPSTWFALFPKDSVN